MGLSQDRADPCESGPLRAAGFFLLRTPLLPRDVFLRPDEEFGAGGGDEDLVQTQRAMLRQRLQELLAQPLVQESIGLCSPSLMGSLAEWRSAPESEAGQKVERALVRYLTRLSTRATPFALCAGVSVGRVGERTLLQLPGAESYRRRSRLAPAYVHRLADRLSEDQAIRSQLRFLPNSSLYAMFDEHRYHRWTLRDGLRVYELSTQVRTPELDAVLEQAAGGATLSELVDRAAAVSGDRGQASQLVEQLIERQVLVTGLEPPVTGGEPLAWLAERLGELPAGQPSSRAVQRVADALQAIDDSGLAARPDSYQTLDAALAELPLRESIAAVLQVDLWKPAVAAVLALPVVRELAQAVVALSRLAPPQPDPLAVLRQAYSRRYDDFETPRFLPLMQLLDPDSGVGLDGPQGAAAGWLAGVELPRTSPSPQLWRPRDEMLLAKLMEASQSGAVEIVLSEADLDRMAPGPASPLPDSLSVIATLAVGPVDPGDFRVHLRHARGPSAARLLGRFCHEEKVRTWVQRLLQEEQSADPEAVFAEVVHIPAGPLELMLVLQDRPLLRQYEIPFLGRSGAPLSRQLPLSDLLICVQDGRTTLWSQRLGRRVIPRTASAHRYEYRKTHAPYYRLLNCMQSEGGVQPYLGWNWGPLAGRPFLPRVCYGKAVLSLARWRLSAAEIAALDGPTASARLRAARKLRGRGLPRMVRVFAIEDPAADHRLEVDLENSLSLDSFVHFLQQHAGAVVEEVFPTPAAEPVTGPGGRFVHELVVPLLRTPPKQPAPQPVATQIQRTFPPGTEWLYLRLQGGLGRLDHVLLHALLPVVRDALASGAADQWFFLRLGLPTPQLRLRVRIATARQAEVRNKFDAVLDTLIKRGELWAASYETYEREVDRYGGDAGIQLAERIFQADSEAVVAILAGLSPLLDEPARWRLALWGIDALLADCEFSVGQKLSIMQSMCRRWHAEQGVDAAVEHQLAQRFRAERVELERLLTRAGPAVRGREAVWERRSAQLRPLVRELAALAAGGGQVPPLDELAQHFVHMHAIRMAVRHCRRHEVIVYEFLRRLYRSQVARAGAAAQKQKQ